jgi:DNA-binding NarL/FixJ family response regulator
MTAPPPGGPHPQASGTGSPGPADVVPTAPIRVLLADDIPLLRMGFRLILDNQPGITVVGEAADGTQAVELTSQLHPDVILMDVRMPRLDGIAATRQIIKATPATRIIILTTFDLDEYAFAGLEAGASGFLLKDTQPADLIAAVHHVASGDAVIAPRMTRRLLDAYLTQPPGRQAAASATDRAFLARLTPRERDVLIALADGLSNAEIAARFVLAETTVKTHVGRILTKLHLRDRVQAVVYAHTHGITGR